MDFEQVLKEVVWRLVTEGRISYRRIKLSFALDDDGLEELRSELIGIKRGAADVDGERLVWAPEARAARPEPMAGAVIVFSEISIDGGLQVGDRVEDTAADALPGHLGKEVLDSVEPGSRGRREMEGPTRMTRQPGQHPRLREGRLLGCLWVA